MPDGSHTHQAPTERLALVDVSPLFDPSVDPSSTVAEIDRACRDLGFFRIEGHGIDPQLLTRLEAASHRFFAKPDTVKQTIAMALAGAAWRGWFPMGDEFTSGRPDRKEGLYVGAEHPDEHPHVVAGTPLHGRNLFLDDELRAAVTEWMNALRPIADAVMGGIAMGLGLDADWFEQHLTADPTVLFRIFHYPIESPSDTAADDWGVGEHTDYGLLTLLAQDGNAGLQVRSTDGRWLDVPPDPGVIVCNIGDMLDRLTEGRYRSTAHRVRNTSGASRLSFPFFFDPSWDAVVTPLPLDGSPPATAPSRWDGSDLQAWTGPYGEYLTAKVARVFPDLFDDVATSG